MTTYGFTVTLSGEKSDDEGDDIADVLYGGRCPDSAVHSAGVTVFVSFDRKAESLDAAVTSALADLHAAGLEATRVQIDDEELTPFRIPLAAAA